MRKPISQKGSTIIRLKIYNQSTEKVWVFYADASHETTRELYDDTKIGLSDMNMLYISIVDRITEVPLSVKEYRYDRKTELWSEPPKEWNRTAIDERYNACSARLYIEPVHYSKNKVNNLALNDDLTVLEITSVYPAEVINLLSLIMGKLETHTIKYFKKNNITKKSQKDLDI